MYFYIKNKKKGPIFFTGKDFFYFHRFIFKNTSRILKKKTYIYQIFFKKTKVFFFAPGTMTSLSRPWAFAVFFRLMNIYVVCVVDEALGHAYLSLYHDVAGSFQL